MNDATRKAIETDLKLWEKAPITEGWCDCVFTIMLQQEDAEFAQYYWTMFRTRAVSCCR